MKSPENLDAKRLRVLTGATLVSLLGYIGVVIVKDEQAYGARRKNIAEITQIMKQEGFVDPFVGWNRRYASVALRDCEVVVGLDLEGGRKISDTEYEPVKDVDYYLHVHMVGNPNMALEFEDSSQIDSLSDVICAGKQ